MAAGIVHRGTGSRNMRSQRCDTWSMWYTSATPDKTGPAIEGDRVLISDVSVDALRCGLETDRRLAAGISIPVVF